jgi:hypothetical protein
MQVMNMRADQYVPNEFWIVDWYVRMVKVHCEHVDKKTCAQALDCEDGGLLWEEPVEKSKADGG